MNRFVSKTLLFCGIYIIISFHIIPIARAQDPNTLSLRNPCSPNPCPANNNCVVTRNPNCVFPIPILCQTATCEAIDLCENVTCRPGATCLAGQCVLIDNGDPCDPDPCQDGERCVETPIQCIRAPCPQYECVPIDPCEGVTCRRGFRCRQGRCVRINERCPSTDGVSTCVATNCRRNGCRPGLRCCPQACGGNSCQRPVFDEDNNVDTNSSNDIGDDFFSFSPEFFQSMITNIKK